MFKFEDLKYLFKNEKVESKDIYRQDIERNNRIVNSINRYNTDFSQSMFLSWVSNIFLRYILLCSSKEDTEKLKSFEKVHVLPINRPFWRINLNIYNSFDDINVKYVDYIDYTHTEDEDYLLLKICLTCKFKDNSEISDTKLKFFDIKFKKFNDSVKTRNGTSYTSNCPNCGAPTSIATFGVCDHCQELVSIYDNVWKIVSIDE